MTYDESFWNEYTKKDDSNYNEEFAKFVRDLAVSLRTSSVLEVGCNTGNDLKLFTEKFNIHGIDLNDKALEKAKEKIPNGKFQKADAINLPYEDSSIDFIFTHNVLNYLKEESDISSVLKELFRVSSKYILNCELYNEEESPIEGKPGANYRNVYKKWLDFEVKIISNVEMHEDIEPEKPRFVLVRKLQS